MLSCFGCVALTLLVLAPSAFAQSVDGCETQSTAEFTPGVTSSSQAFTYAFTGKLQECRSSESGVGLNISGNFEAGQTVNEQVENSITGETEAVTYQEPVPTGSGGCGDGTTSGIALESWADGTYTVESYSTTGTLEGVDLLSGNVVASMTLTAVNAQPGDPTTFTIVTNRFAGDTVLGLLLFKPPELTACTTSTGATTAAISGAVAIGSS